MAEIVPKERINSRDFIREISEKNPKKEMKTSTEIPDTSTESHPTTSTSTSTTTSTSTYSYPGILFGLLLINEYGFLLTI